MRHVFHAGQHAGIDVLPRHFYSSIPDIRELKRDPRWKRPLSMTGVNGIDVDAQLRFVADCCGPLRERMAREDLYAQMIADAGEVGYGPIEANFLFCFMMAHRPRRVVQVGAGTTTALMLRAAGEAGAPLSLTCVDPYPGEYLQRCAREGRINLMPQKAQEVPPAVLADLQPGDLLFIDSSHTVKVGSDVNHLILEVLPLLPANVYVHFHDIYFPYDYNRTLMTDVIFSTESTLLHAFLVGNSRFSIAASLSMLHYARAKELQALIPPYRPQANDEGLAAGTDGHFPSSVYLRTHA